MVGPNGAAALLGRPGDKVIIMAFCGLATEEATEHQATVVHVGAGNRPIIGVPAKAGAPLPSDASLDLRAIEK